MKTNYVFTDKAEQTAKALNLDERKSGTAAHCGYEIMENFGPTKTAWLDSGYIKYVDEPVEYEV